MSHVQVILKKPVFKPPACRPDWNDPDLDRVLQHLQHHLQTAMIVEMYTIPLYLFAAYSIKDSPLSTYKIINVVKQEMLHLGLAGNILRSINGNPRLYGSKYTPEYPREIFYEPLAMNLRSAAENIATFIKLEKPADHDEKWRRQDPVLPDYDSIGDFYQELRRGIRIVNKNFISQGRRLFVPSTFPQQLQTADGSWYDEDMRVITDLEVADASMNIIIEQGEGSTGSKIPSGIQSHFEVFKELEKQVLDCYPIVENIDPNDYKNETFYPVMEACDAAYSYLLMTIEILWRYDGPLRGRLVTNNVMSLMLNILKPLAQFLVKQSITSGSNKDKHAAPAFRHFELETFADLKQVTQKALDAYPNEKHLQSVKKHVDKLIDLGTLTTDSDGKLPRWE